MVEKYNNYIVPLWISSRVYECNINGESVCKTFILNSKTHDYITFEDNAAKLWSFILNSDYTGLIEYAKENDLYDELDLFFEELLQIGLVCHKNNKKDIDITYEQMLYDESENDELELFCDNMADWQYRNGFLSSLFIELTYKCNLKCIHCFNDKEKKEKEITFEEIKPVIDNAIELGIFSVTLSGGECTLAKDFLNIAKYIREKKIALYIYTNGQTLYENPKLCEELIALYPTMIFFSLYSMDEEVHDKITKIKGSHKKTLSVIKNLAKMNVPVGIKCFLTKYNIDSPEKIKNFAKEIGVSVAFDMTLLQNKDKSNKEVSVDISQMNELYKNKSALFYKNIRKFDAKQIRNLNSIMCKGGHYFFSIDPNLDVYPCASLKEKFGSLKNTSLLDIRSDKNSKLTNFLGLRKSDLKECHTEEYCNYCSYCMGIAKADNGFLKKSETCCAQAKAKMEISLNLK